VDRDEIGPTLQRLAARAVVELGRADVRLHGLVQVAVESGMDDTHKNSLIQTHARAITAASENARAYPTSHHPEERDLLYPDLMLALRRMVDRCLSGDKTAAHLSYTLASEAQVYRDRATRETFEAINAGYEAVIRVSTPESPSLLWAAAKTGL